MKKRILSALMALLLTATLPAAAFAEEYDLANGSIEVSADAAGQYVTQTDFGITNQAQTSETVITQIGSAPTTNTVTINAASGATAEVTFDGVNIDTSTTGGAAVSTEGNGDVTVELDNSNTIKSGPGYAGLEKNSAGELTITDTDNDGSLVATGGNYGAGIGGGSNGNGSNITIEGGTITATGNNGAGIGGGFNGSGSNITITGGTVTAVGGSSSAGIGGGRNGSGSNITITGGTVIATGGDCGAGIGGGYMGNGSDITITGGKVTATGGAIGAGIGGGYFAGGRNIKVWDDAQLKVQGGSATTFCGTGAAIGNGGSGDLSEINPGAEVTPNTEELTKDGKIEYYAPGVDMNSADSTETIVGTHEHAWDDGKVTVEPTDTEKGEITYTCTAGNGFTKTEEIPALTTAATQSEYTLSSPLYRVTDRDGKDISYKTEQNDGVLTVTVDSDFAVLTGMLSGINTLKAQGVEKIVFATNGASSTFTLADLLAKGSMGSAYKLTHDGATVTFTLGASSADVSSILG